MTIAGVFSSDQRPLRSLQMSQTQAIPNFKPALVSNQQLKSPAGPRSPDKFATSHEFKPVKCDHFLFHVVFVGESFSAEVLSFLDLFHSA